MKLIELTRTTGDKFDVNPFHIIFTEDYHYNIVDKPAIGTYIRITGDGGGKYVRETRAEIRELIDRSPQVEKVLL